MSTPTTVKKMLMIALYRLPAFTSTVPFHFAEFQFAEP